MYVGSTPVKAVYVGADKVWPPDTPTPTARFIDDFERADIGAAWTGTGAIISTGMLKKGAGTGSADLWTSQQFDTDDLDVTVTVGDVTDSIPSSILIGSPAAYVYVEFGTGTTQIGQYDGVGWTILATAPAQAWAKGDTVRLARNGQQLALYRNGAQIATATSAAGIGATHRRVALSVRSRTVFLSTYYSPLIDKVVVA